MAIALYKLYYNSTFGAFESLQSSKNGMALYNTTRGLLQPIQSSKDDVAL
jgi:hypothetical protein